MIGIYKFTNKTNNKAYIGQSINIEKRKSAHYYSAFYEKASDYNSQFHQAIRKYGIKNFDFEILYELKLEEYNKDFLDILEKYFIEKHDSFKNGYNATYGGLEEFSNREQPGEKNGRALLSEKDVIDIRESYNNKIPFSKVYDKYKDKISKRGLQNVWWFNTWKKYFQNITRLKIKDGTRLKQKLTVMRYVLIIKDNFLMKK